MADASEDLMILRRAVSRTQGRVSYAGSVSAREAHRLVELGLARLMDVRVVPGQSVYEFGEALRKLAAPTECLLFISGEPQASHEAATLAAKAGFHCALNVLEGRDRYPAGAPAFGNAAGATGCR